MFEALPEYDGERFRRLRAEHDAGADAPALDIEARDRREKWRRCARVNCDATGVFGAVEIVGADAREEPLAADCVVTNLPFGIRVSEDLQSLYRAFSDQLLEGDVDRLVALTTAPELLSLEPTERYEIPYGRLDATIVVWER
jgi:23S rRNA G2445 N2-methylase RlmL